MIQHDLEKTIESPLRSDEDGVIRVAGTRVRLETVVGAYEDGATAEQILRKYPALPIDAIYATIAYYLQNSESLKRYFEHRNEQEVTARKEIDERFPSAGIRDRLLARRQNG